MANKSELLQQFFARQKQLDGNKTKRWWAKKWGVSEASVSKWISGSRTIGPECSHVFEDLDFTPEQYYRERGRRPQITYVPIKGNVP